MKDIKFNGSKTERFKCSPAQQRKKPTEKGSARFFPVRPSSSPYPLTLGCKSFKMATF